MKNFTFDSLDDLDKHFDDDGVIDTLIDTDEEGGKHDTTNHWGWYEDCKGDWWSICYDVSYNWGVSTIDVRGPYIKTTKIVTLEKNVFTAKGE